MKNQLIIRQAIVFLEEEFLFHPLLSLKFSFSSQIFHQHGFKWNASRCMWESKSTIKIPWPDDNPIDLEVYYQHKTGRQIILGEGRVSNNSLDSFIGKEIKILLVYDGICTGTIYCELFATEEEENQHPKKFLCIHRIDFKIFKESEMIISLSLLKNGEELYQKDVQLQKTQKSLFPNVKTPIRLSDQITIRIGHPRISLKDVSFLADSLARGNSNSFEVTLRNNFQGRAGKLRMDHFMQNFFLENEKQHYIRNGIFGKKLVSLTMVESPKPRIRRSGLIRQAEEANKRFKILDLTTQKSPFGSTACSRQKQNRNTMMLPLQKSNTHLKKMRYSSQAQLNP